MRDFDIIVVGSGIAGLSFALEAAGTGRVALVTKRGRGDSNTAWAQGGIACVMSNEDSFDLHIRDTLRAGAGLCHEDVVRAVVNEGPESIARLVEFGVRFDERTEGGGSNGLDLGREGGHSKRRILHVRDATGIEIESALLDRIAAHPSIEVMENHMAIDLITTGKLGFAMQNSCVGAYVLDESTGRVETLRAPTTVLASGGCGKVYLYTTNPDISTGDGVAMAWRAGAVISNMEFVQFHPTCLYHPVLKSFLVSEAVRGEGGILLDSAGRRFMENAHPLKELAPRDIVARAIDAEMKRSGSKCVHLDITSKSADFIRHRFPTIHDTCLAHGIDMTREPIPVVPAAHYQCGGVQTDLNGETSIRGLFAIGEAACTGLHGANRLASNSLLEGLVMARRAYRKIALNNHARPRIDLPEWRAGEVTDVDELVVISHNWEEIRRLMWDYVGIVRTDKRLRRAATRLRNLHAEVQEFYWNFKVTTDLLELRNLVTVASLVVDCALQRKESRGLHFTLDHPQTDDERFRHDTVMRRF
jgi:L-aspartate oxidase